MADAPPDRLTPTRLAIAVARCVRFYSRLPMPRLSFESDAHAVPDFRVEPAGLPFAALLIVLPGLIALALGHALLRDPLLAAALTITVMVIATGAFHEDGLGDTCDGLFGGHDPQRRLEIMKDSRIGVFAGSAIALSLILRVTALTAILKAGGLDAALAGLALAAIWSRVEGVRLLAALPTARAYGAAAAVGRPTIRIALLALGLAAGLAAVLAMVGGLPLAGVLLALALASLAVTGLGALSRRLIGGQTGDIAGAAQQISEIVILLVLAGALAA